MIFLGQWHLQGPGVTVEFLTEVSASCTSCAPESGRGIRLQCHEVQLSSGGCFCCISSCTPGGNVIKSAECNWYLLAGDSSAEIASLSLTTDWWPWCTVPFTFGLALFAPLPFVSRKPMELDVLIQQHTSSLAKKNLLRLLMRPERHPMTLSSYFMRISLYGLLHSLSVVMLLNPSPLLDRIRKFSSHSLELICSVCPVFFFNLVC